MVLSFCLNTSARSACSVSVSLSVTLNAPCTTRLVVLLSAVALELAPATARVFSPFCGGWRFTFTTSSEPASFSSNHFRSIRYLLLGSVVSKVKVRKSCNERGLQKLDMPDSHFQLLQSHLSICNLGAEQILIMIILRLAR